MSDYYAVNAIQNDAAYLWKGEVPDDGESVDYLSDYYGIEVVPLGGDRFVLFFFADETPDGSQDDYNFSQIITATSAGWTAGSRETLPSAVTGVRARDTGVQVGTDRILLTTRQTKQVHLLDFTSGAAALVATADLPGTFPVYDLFRIADGTVVCFMSDFTLTEWPITPLTVDGDTITVGTALTVDWQAGRRPIVLGNKTLHLGSQQVPNPVYADNPDYPDGVPMPVPLWHLVDIPTMTVTEFEPTDNTHQLQGAQMGVALNDSQAFVYMWIFGDYDVDTNTYSPQDQGWLATITIDGEGGFSVDRMDGANWPNAVQYEVMGSQVGPEYEHPSPWIAPDEIQPSKTLNPGYGKMLLLPSGLIAYTCAQGYESKNDNAWLVFFWDVAQSRVVGWTIVKSGRKQTVVDEDIYLNYAEADNRSMMQGPLSDGGLLMIMDEAYQIRESTNGPYTESIWASSVAYSLMLNPGLTAGLGIVGQRFL